MSEITNGKWEYRNNFGQGIIIVLNKTIAIISRLPEQEANGRLIASAPELLASCVEMMKELEYQNNDYRNGFGGHEDLVERAKLAINRAKGETE